MRDMCYFYWRRIDQDLYIRFFKKVNCCPLLLSLPKPFLLNRNSSLTKTIPYVLIPNVQYNIQSPKSESYQTWSAYTRYQASIAPAMVLFFSVPSAVHRLIEHQLVHQIRK